MSIELIDTKLLKPFKFPRIVHQGYLYHFHKKCAQHLRWKCSRVYSGKCQCVLRTTTNMLDLELIAVDHGHQHENDETAITELKNKIAAHQKSSMFRNSTMFKPKKVNINNTGKHIKSGEKHRLCATTSDNFLDDTDKINAYKDAYEQPVEDKIAKAGSSNFEYYPNNPYNKLEQTNHQEKIETVTDADSQLSEDTPSATIALIQSIKTLKCLKESLNNTHISSESDTDIKVTKKTQKRSKRLRKMKQNESCLPSIELNEDILSATTPTISTTKFKKTNMNISTTLQPVDFGEDEPLDEQPSGTSKELLNNNNNIKNLTQITMIDSNEPSTLSFDKNSIDSIPALTQHDTKIEVNNSKMIEDNESSTTVYIDLTVDSPPDKTASRPKNVLVQSKKEIDIIPVSSATTDLGSSTAKSSIAVTNRSSNLLPNNATAESIECNATRQTNQVQSTSVYEQVTLPTVLVCYDKTTKKRTVLYPKMTNQYENPSISSNLVDIRNITYESKVPTNE